MVCILFSRMLTQTQLKMCLLIKYLLSEFCALVMIAGHSRSLLHKTGYNGAQCRNESVGPNFWTAVCARVAIRATNPSLLDCWARAPVTLSATDRWIAYTQPCFQWSSVSSQPRRSSSETRWLRHNGGGSGEDRSLTCKNATPSPRRETRCCCYS